MGVRSKRREGARVRWPVESLTHLKTLAPLRCRCWRCCSTRFLRLFSSARCRLCNRKKNIDILRGWWFGFWVFFGWVFFGCYDELIAEIISIAVPMFVCFSGLIFRRISPRYCAQFFDYCCRGCFNCWFCLVFFGLHKYF